jgi:hypothetical protein
MLFTLLETFACLSICAGRGFCSWSTDKLMYTSHIMSSDFRVLAVFCSSRRGFFSEFEAKLAVQSSRSLFKFGVALAVQKQQIVIQI